MVEVGWRGIAVESMIKLMVARLVVVGHGYWKEMKHTVVYGGIAMHDGDSLSVVAHRGDLVIC